jgi:3-dehydroquinate dehydratase
MKKTHIYIIVLAVLLVIGGVTFVVNYQEQKEKEAGDFTVKNVESVQKIFLKDKEGKTMLLQRDKDGWLLNEKFKANQQFVNELLEAISNAYAFAPLANSAQENAIKQMSIKSTRVEIYTSNLNKPEKVYYVGMVSPGKKGTNMLLEKDGNVAKKVYEVRLPGFNGYITERFYIDETLWRETMLFDLMPGYIREVKISYHGDRAGDSFTLTNDNGKFRLETADNVYEHALLNEEFTINYLMSFSKKTVETYANDYAGKDSVIANLAFADMKITDVNGNEKFLQIFHMPSDPKSKQQFDDEGEKVAYDVDRLFALVNDGKDFAVIQYYTFGTFFQEPKKFVRK